jgi:uncharacterized protein YlxP (DUF503 family)
MTIFVGVLRIVLFIPGARSLKDGRAALASIRDKVRHRFDVSAHEMPSDLPARRTLVFTTSGSDAKAIRSVLDRIRSFVEASDLARAAEVDADVFPWLPSHVMDGSWPIGLDAEPDGESDG